MPKRELTVLEYFLVVVIVVVAYVLFGVPWVARFIAGIGDSK